MISRTPIDNHRIRKICGSFSWIDHRLLSGGFLKTMTSNEILLYFFLVLVGDRNGVSFYSYDKICQLLKIDVDRFIHARNRLLQKSLIATENGRFQVLQLPQHNKQSKSDVQRSSQGKMVSLKQILQQIIHERERV
jgi:hypothetical protein